MSSLGQCLTNMFDGDNPYIVNDITFVDNVSHKTKRVRHGLLASAAVIGLAIVNGSQHVRRVAPGEIVEPSESEIVCFMLHCGNFIANTDTLLLYDGEHWQFALEPPRHRVLTFADRDLLDEAIAAWRGEQV